MENLNSSMNNLTLNSQPKQRITVDYDETPRVYIRDDVRDEDGKPLVKRFGPHGLPRLTIEEIIGPTEHIPQRLLPGRTISGNIEPNRPFGKTYYETPNTKTLKTIKKAEKAGWRAKMRRRKPWAKNEQELERIREQRKNNSEFRWTEDETRPDYYAALRARKWFDPLPDPTDTRGSEFEEGLHECWKEQHKGQEYWSRQKWNDFWKHATSRSAQQDFRKFK